MKGKFIENIRLKLTAFSGEDGYVLKQCPTSLRIHFAIIGFFVVLIFIGCFISATTFTFSLFNENPFISVPFGVLWASIITVIYLLLLYTISPPTLPSKYKSNNKDVIVNDEDHNKFFTISMVLRISFMTLLAIIIAQPLNVYFLSNNIESSLDKFKQLQKANMTITADSLFVQEELKAKADFEKYASVKLSSKEFEIVKEKVSQIDNKVSLDGMFITKAYQLLDSITKYQNNNLFVLKNKKQDSIVNELNILLNIEVQSDYDYQIELGEMTTPNIKIVNEFNIYKNQLDKIISNKIENNNKLEDLISKSNFYIQKIKILLNENIFSWIITLLVIGVFLLPIRMKYLVRNKGFYKKKTEIEERLVKEAYDDFTKIFSKTLEHKINAVNGEVFKRLEISLTTLKVINPEKYNYHLKEIKAELKSEKIDFYENWKNPPFRTIRFTDKTKFNSEKEFLELLYKNGEA